MLETNTAPRKLSSRECPPPVDAEDHRFGHTIDHRADDDSHRTADPSSPNFRSTMASPTRKIATRLIIHRPSCQGSQLGLARRLNRDRGQHGAGTEPGERTLRPLRATASPSRPSARGEQQRDCASKPKPNALNIRTRLLTHQRHQHDDTGQFSDTAGVVNITPRRMSSLRICWSMGKAKLGRTQGVRSPEHAGRQMAAVAHVRQNSRCCQVCSTMRTSVSISKLPA